jgi:hypothetical protein
MNRYRVRAAHKKWTDRGPDLLRTRDNAIQAARAVMAGHEGPWHTRKRKGSERREWSEGMSRADALDRLRAWKHDGTDIFELGVSDKDGKVSAVAVVKHEDVKVVELAHCTAQTVQGHSLIHHQFPNIVHSGGFFYRQVSGSSDWSDHAWGTGTDDTHNPSKGVSNDEVTDWLARMGQSRNIEFDYALGSRDGKVVAVQAPDYNIEPSGAADSHLWHNHVSWVDHDGRKPPRNPMVS